MRLIRAAEHRRVPWKNGRGETLEIAVAPDGADQDGFAWHVSLAEIAGPGPFSCFPGVDRTLALLEGGPLRLQVGHGPPVDLPAGSPPLPFAGDLATEAWLLGGPALALNVMTRRDAVSHLLTRHATATRAEIGGAAPALLLCRSGEVRITAGSESATLGPMDSLRLDPADPAWRLQAEAPAVVYVAQFLPGTFTDGSGTSGRDRSTP